jgi:hypothetical protein
LSNTEVYALSSDEQLSVYTLSEPATEQVEVEEDDVDEVVLPVVAFGDVRQSLQSSYVVDVFVGATTTPGGRRAWVASGNAASNTLTMVPLKPSWAFDTSSLVSFPKAHGDELVRDFLIDDEVSSFFFFLFFFPPSPCLFPSFPPYLFSSFPPCHLLCSFCLLLPYSLPFSQLVTLCSPLSPQNRDTKYSKTKNHRIKESLHAVKTARFVYGPNKNKNNKVNLQSQQQQQQ